MQTFRVYHAQGKSTVNVTFGWMRRSERWTGAKYRKSTTETYTNANDLACHCSCHHVTAGYKDIGALKPIIGLIKSMSQLHFNLSETRITSLNLWSRELPRAQCTSYAYTCVLPQLHSLASCQSVQLRWETSPLLDALSDIRPTYTPWRPYPMVHPSLPNPQRLHISSCGSRRVQQLRKRRF